MARRIDSDDLPPELERLGAELAAATAREVAAAGRRRRLRSALATVLVAAPLAALAMPGALGNSLHTSNADDPPMVVAAVVPDELSRAGSCVQPHPGATPAGRCQWREALGDPAYAAALLNVRPN